MSSGERFSPEEHDIIISLEHWHRYVHISDLVSNKDILDVASGMGYGANLLAKNANSVVGVDISEQAVASSRNKYFRENLSYQVASVSELPFENDIFDIVVSFETIEHISESLQLKFLEEVKRVLKEDGVFIVSTPEKYYYSDLRNYNNEFHIKEFYEKEFRTFLNGFFSNVQFNYQTTLIGSNIFNDINDDIEYKYATEQSGKACKEYLIAYCENTGDFNVPKASINVDYENKFFLNLNTHHEELWFRINSSEAQLTTLTQENQELWSRVNSSESQLTTLTQENQELWSRVNSLEKLTFIDYLKKMFKK